MSTARIGRWGKSLAVRIPSDLAGRLALADGATVEVEQRDDEIVIRKLVRPLTLESLFAGKSHEEWRAIYREHGVDWGPDVGREIVEE
jgi:antitoxin MazE